MSASRDILIRYGEIGTKKKNRQEFEKILVSNIKQALPGMACARVERLRGRIRIKEAEDPLKALARVCELPGVVSASVAVSTEPEMALIREAGALLMGEALAAGPGDQVTFKVETVRAFKGFPLKSMELSAELGAVLLDRFPRLKVRMKDPDILLAVEVREEEVILSIVHERGPGGLPVGSTGKVVVLLSGGIDSPVAAYMAMKRGARAIFINYHSFPFIPHSSLDKIKVISKTLARFQGTSLLYVVPFADIQVAIKKRCPEELRTILYRRMMLRLAERAAEEAGALALVTGESLGQVASQTLENIGCIAAATRMPVLRPLIGFDKVEAVALARRIGTYDLSIQPYPDSCIVFQPRHPKIRGTQAGAERAEERLDVLGMVEEAFAKVERLRIEF